MPDISGISEFAGPIIHTAAWNDSIDLASKRVAIIGAGASAAQVLPAIQPICGYVNIYIRTPSWSSPPFGLPPDRGSNPIYTETDKQHFRQDAAFSLQTRKSMEAKFNCMFAAFSKASPEQENMRNNFDRYMRNLIRDPAMQEKLIPHFEAGCRRINPSKPYLAALQEPNVQPVFDPITRISSEGVVIATADGDGNSIKTKTYPPDILIAATGFDTSFRPRFPIIGHAGIDLRNIWASDPVSYMGTGVAGFPNYLTFLGPNTPISNGSLMGKSVNKLFLLRIFFSVWEFL